MRVTMPFKALHSDGSPCPHRGRCPDRTYTAVCSACPHTVACTIRAEAETLVQLHRRVHAAGPSVEPDEQDALLRQAVRLALQSLSLGAVTRMLAGAGHRDDPALAARLRDRLRATTVEPADTGYAELRD
jgi:hypothetical protein